MSEQEPGDRIAPAPPRGQDRASFLLALSDRLREGEPEAALQQACEIMGQHFACSRVGYGHLDREADTFDYRVCWTDGTVPPLLGRFPARAFGVQIVARLARGETVVVEDIFADEVSAEAETQATAEAVDTRAILVVPFLWAGRLHTIVYLNSRDVRAWRPDEVALVEEVAERTRKVIELAEAARDRAAAEAALRELNTSLERRVAEALAERRLLAAIVEASDALVQVVDTEFRWLALNRACADTFEHLFGVRPTVGVSMLEAYAHMPTQQAAVRARWSRALAGERFTSMPHFPGATPGDDRWFELAFSPLYDAEGRLVGAYQFAHDVTARVHEQERLAEAEAQLRQIQKMEAMGQLTGGVAHDFNNLLTPIIGALDLLQRSGAGGERERRLVAGALQSADRARILVQRLLAFARRQPLQPVAVDLGSVVRGMAELVASTVGPQIHVAVETDPDLAPAQADRNQLEMALLNLAVNARDAMPDGGTIRISAVNAEVAPGERGDLSPGRYVRLSVADTGTGMDEATAARAVEPFFSTKGVGKGTGLGLSMAHGLAQQLGGALTLKSRLGVGTNVELWLPQSAEPAVEAPGRAVGATPPAGQGLALLVDDEPLVRASTAQMLADLGFTVEEAAAGEAALAQIEAGLRPDLLVTDHLMPGLKGDELARAVRVAAPGTRVLIVSGYADLEGIDPTLPRLTKPFLEDELAAAIAALGPGPG